MKKHITSNSMLICEFSDNLYMMNSIELITKLFLVKMKQVINLSVYQSEKAQASTPLYRLSVSLFFLYLVYSAVRSIVF